MSEETKLAAVASAILELANAVREHTAASAEIQALAVGLAREQFEFLRRGYEEARAEGAAPPPRPRPTAEESLAADLGLAPAPGAGVGRCEVIADDEFQPALEGATRERRPIHVPRPLAPPAWLDDSEGSGGGDLGDED